MASGESKHYLMAKNIIRVPSRIEKKKKRVFKQTNVVPVYCASQHIKCHSQTDD